MCVFVFIRYVFFRNYAFFEKQLNYVFFKCIFRKYLIHVFFIKCIIFRKI